MKVYLKLFSYLHVIKKEIAQKTLIGIAISGIYVLQAVLMAQVMNLVWTNRSLSDQGIMVRIVGIAIVIVLRSIMIRENESMVKVLAAKIKGKIRIVLIDQIFRLGPGYVNNNRSGRLTSLVLDGIESLESFFVNYIPQVFTVFVTGTVIFIYLFLSDAISAVILLISMLLCIFVPIVSVPVIFKSVTDYWTVYSLLTSQYIDSIQGMTTLKTLGAEPAKTKELEKDAVSFYRQSVRNTAISLADSSVMLILMAITSSLTVVVTALRFANGSVSTEAVTAFLFLAIECARPMMDLNRAWHSSFLGLSVAQEMFELIEKQPDVKEKEHAVEQCLSSKAPEIAFEHVSFQYTNDSQTLQNVSFYVKGGEVAAFAGPSGAGKSTILNLLLRFYDVNSGRITYNGIDIRDLSLDYLRKNIAVVFQDTYLFYGTIYDNIRMAKPEASKEEIIKAAKGAYAHEFIMDFQEGYETMVGERGVTLSGGQKQRIAIARALLKDAKILLLDEATSSVDAASEQKLQESLAKLSKGRTTIIVAHRLSTIQDADQIFVLDEGQLVESGTHKELLLNNGVYSRLIRAQEVSSHVE